MTVATQPRVLRLVCSRCGSKHMGKIVPKDDQPIRAVFFPPHPCTRCKTLAPIDLELLVLN